MSPDLTRCPPAAQIDTAAGTWTIAGNVLMLNGADTTGRGSQLLLVGGVVYGLGTDGNWFRGDVVAGAVKWTSIGPVEPIEPIASLPGFTYTYSRRIVTNPDGSTTETVGIPDATMQTIVAADIAAWLAVPMGAIDALVAQNLQAMARASAADLDAGYGKAATAYMRALDAYDGAPGTPVYVHPGDLKKATAADNAVIELLANGSIYRNGLRMFAGTKPTNASVGLVYGNALFMKGATDATWYQLVGANWTKVSGGDPALFT